MITLPLTQLELYPCKSTGDLDDSTKRSAKEFYQKELLGPGVLEKYILWVPILGMSNICGFVAFEIV